MSKSALASKLGIGRRTIRYWIASGQLDRELDDDVVRCKKLWSAKKKIAYRWIDFLRSTAEDDRLSFCTIRVSPSGGLGRTSPEIRLKL